MRKIRMQVKLLPTKNLERRGYGIYSGYIRRTQKALKTKHKILSESSVQELPKRLVPHKVAYSPTLCVAIDDMFFARCNREVSMPGRVFCDICQPKGTR
jgi:hypothetical protein